MLEMVLHLQEHFLHVVEAELACLMRWAQHGRRACLRRSGARRLAWDGADASSWSDTSRHSPTR
jgi:hypothetical protein